MFMLLMMELSKTHQIDRQTLYLDRYKENKKSNLHAYESQPPYHAR